MGKTSKPLIIVALPPCDEWDELKKLEVQGHTVFKQSNSDNSMITFETLMEADIILGANCWRMTALHSKYLPVAIKEARMLRYPTKEERQDAKLRKAADAEFAVGDWVQPESGTDDVELPPN